jgi:hypothetical protein
METVHGYVPRMTEQINASKISTGETKGKAHLEELLVDGIKKNISL